MSYSLTPAKRLHEKSPREANGIGKLAKIQNIPLKTSSNSTVFRLLCPLAKIGRVIGKAGSVISKIRQDTDAKIKVEDLVPGCDERVIVIAASDKETELTTSQIKEDSEETKVAEEGGDMTKHCEDDNNKEPETVEGSKREKEISSALKALLLVFERMSEEETEMDEGDEETNMASEFVARLVVPSCHVGCLSGNSDSVIKHMSSESGAHILVLPREKLPPCISASDELVEITGGSEAVRKALQSVSQQLLENPPRDHDSYLVNSTGPSSNSFDGPNSKPEVFQQQPEHYFHVQGARVAARSRDDVPKNHGSGRINPSENIVTFRLLCHEDNVGGVIGKGGTIIKKLQHETGCEIKVHERVTDSDDRLVIISGPVHPDERVSAPQDAVLRVQTRIVKAGPNMMDKTVTAKIIVSANQIEFLLGKGGSIIAEMRKSTRAYIHILEKDQIPKCVPENEEVIQINGEFETVQEVLFQITVRMQEHFFRDTFPSVNHPINPAFQDQVPPFPSLLGRRELSPRGMYAHLGNGLHPHVGFYPHDERSPFMHNIHRPGFPSHISGRTPSSAPWNAQGRVDGSEGFLDYAGPPQRRIPGYGSGSHSPIITNTTMEVIVPRTVVPSIYGEDGGCLKQIRQISDAKITINEPNPGATETVIIISGTPEQAHAAQSLIQAFVMSEAESN